MHLLIASTIPAWAARSRDPGVSQAWLTHMEDILSNAEDHGHTVDVFAALEVDGGTDPFAELRGKLAKHNGTSWRFRVDDNCRTITSMNRLGRICTGRNLAIEFSYAMDGHHEAILWVDADVYVPPMAVVVLARIMEMAGQINGWYPAVGGHVPTYGLNGPPVNRPDIGPDLRFHWTTAGFFMVSRDVFSTIRWGHWGELTDDPWYQRRILDAFGTETIVDHSLIGLHHQQQLSPLEERGHDLFYRR
jgi:hypothetical protein